MPGPARLSFVVSVAALVMACSTSPAAPPVGTATETDNPTIPVGYDAYRQWDRWPYLRLATRTSMRSTYDRAGGNEGADASHFLRVTSSRAVALDVEGSGVLAFSRFNHDHGSPWHFVVDGHDTRVLATAIAGSARFPSPLALASTTTHGADLIDAVRQERARAARTRR